MRLHVICWLLPELLAMFADGGDMNPAQAADVALSDR